MTLRLEKVSATTWALMSDTTVVAEISDTVIRVNGSLKLGTDLVSPSGAELAALDGLTKSSSQLNALVGGVAGGYLIARSAAPVELDGTNPTSVAHGLTTCLAAFAQLVGSVAPGSSTSLLTCVINGANIDVYGWKPTGAALTDLVASGGTETFNWFAIGTA